MDTPPVSIVATRSGLVDRELELAELRQHLAEARSGRPSLILVGGDAGIGKTRLLRELVADTTSRVLWGGCLPLGERGLPYLALVEMLRAIDQTEDDPLPPAVQALLPRDDPNASGRAISRSHLFQSVVDLFEAMAADQPLLIVIEDLHWADRSTRDLLDFLGAILHDQRIMVVASYRTGELETDHPLHGLLAEWSRRPRVHRLELEPLSPADATRLLLDRLGDEPASREMVTRLVERAGGNPYFLEELATAGIDPETVPGPLREFLLRRAGGLSAEVTRLLRIASVGGTIIDEHLVGQVAGLDETETRDLLRTAIQAQLVLVDQGRCRFRHALLAEAFHDDLLPSERREYHDAFAELLSRRNPPAPPAELATHLAEAGRPEQALTAWVAAAAMAESQYAFAEALHGYRSALELWNRVTQPETRAGLDRVDLLRRTAEAAFLSGEFATACGLARLAIDEIDPVADPIRCGLTHHRLARYLCDTSEYESALAIQERAIELIPDTPPSSDRAEVLAGLAGVLQFVGRYHDARQWGVQAIEMAEATGADHAGASARNTLGTVICTIEDVDQGLDIIRDALVLAQATGDAHEQMRGHWNLMANLFSAGRWEESIAAARRLEAVFPRLGLAHHLPEAKQTIAEGLFRLGRWEEADATLAEARRLYPSRGDQLAVPELSVARGDLALARELNRGKTSDDAAADLEIHLFNLVNLAEIELAEGNLAEAMALVDEVVSRARGLDVPIALGYGIAAGLTAAADLAAMARLRDKAEPLETSIGAGRRYHQAMTELLGRPGPANGWKREVGALATQADAELSRLEGRPDPEAWDQAVKGWEDLSTPYAAAYCRYRGAESALAAGTDRHQVAPVLVDLVGMLTGLGAKPLADEVRRLARRARIDLGERLSPDRFGLTEREREVLSELATGATNRQIATALYMSEKTASVHVSSILRKLGAANRGEAAATAIREGLVVVSARGS